MSRPIRYRSRFAVPAEQLYATLVDRAYLEAKLARIGGTNATLVELASDHDSAKYTLRQGVDHGQLPGPIQKILRGDLVIERSESWRLASNDRYEGTISARVKDAPGSISGAQRVLRADEGAEFAVDAEAKVDLPLIGGKIESAIAEQLVRLLDREAQFTHDWLAR